MKLQTYKSATAMAVAESIEKTSFSVNASDGVEAAEHDVYVLPALPPSPAAPIDGRPAFAFNAGSLVAAFRADKRPLPVDLNHDTEFNNTGLQGRAVAWILDAFTTEDGGVNVRVKATPEGVALIEQRMFGFTSATVYVNKKGEAVKLKSLALTNNPALLMPAIFDMNEAECAEAATGVTVSNDDDTDDANSFSTQPGAVTEEGLSTATYTAEPAAEQAPADAAAELTVDAFHAQVATFKQEIEALTAERDKLSTSVQALTAERETLTQSLTAATAEVLSLKAAAVEGEITRTLDAAIESGRFVPAAREGLERFARADLAGFKALVESTPVLAIATASATPATRADEPEVDGDVAAFLKSQGLSVDAYVAGLRS